MNGESPAPLVYLIAGEPSGDALGARLMAGLKERTAGRIRFAGIGGEGMAAAGLEAAFPMAELSVMGVAEVLPHLPRLIRRLRETVAHVRALRPAALVTIDSPGFTLRIAKALRGNGIPLIHYVAPTVWAWKPGRARAVARFLDHVMTLFPFEPPYFHRQGLAATFVGHPVLEGGAGAGDGKAFRERHGIAPDAPLLCLLPGSRMGEIGRHLPVMAQTLALLAEERAGLRAVLPAAAAVADPVGEAVAKWPAPPLVLLGDEEKFDAFAASDAALAASGSVTLELALAGTPAIIAYRMNPFSAWLARHLVHVPHAGLINILLGRGVMPEFLFGECRAELLAPALAALFADADARAGQIAGAAEAVGMLSPGDIRPSLKAAEVVLDVIASHNEH